MAMPRFAGLLGALMLAALPGLALAQYADVQCVQERLPLLGDYDPGPADGVAGERTLTAAAAYAADTGLDLPPLSNETAAEWCAALTEASTVPLPHITGIDAVTRLFQQPFDRDWFGAGWSDNDLASLPGLLAGLTDVNGAFVGVEDWRDGLVTVFEHAEVPTEITLDDHNRITYLWFNSPIPIGDDLQNYVDQIAALPGDLSVLVTTNGEPVASYRPDEPLAVGSAAKLAVLKAVAAAVAGGRLTWDQVVRLDRDWYSLPGGFLQTWPVGTAVTIETLVDLMISISDNTATDALIDIVGRDAVQAETARNNPFVTTVELWKLKAVGSEDLLDRWVAADADGRRAILAELAEMPLPAAADIRRDYTGGAEWTMTASEICHVLDSVAGLPVFTINPGPARPDLWSSVAYKGGSEVGVLNLSERLVAADGTVHCVVATWNSTEPLDDDAMTRIFTSIVRTLARSG